MSDDYKVGGRSNAEVKTFAKRVREYLNISSDNYIDVLKLESVDDILTEFGPKPFRLQAVSDAELPEDAGITTFDGTRILVRIPRRIRRDALLGHGYARFTIAHELGHAALHLPSLKAGASMPRRRMGNVKPEWIPKYQSAEHQAMVFAGAFLINDETARRLQSADEIAIQFGLSLDAARIYFEQMLEEIERPIVAKRIRQSAAELKAIVAVPRTPEMSFLSDPCSACGRQKLFPVGHKYMCQACDAIYDRFQDGDPVD
jgi:hypothetical protein